MSKQNKKVIREGNASSMTWGVKNPGGCANQAGPKAGKGEYGHKLPAKVRKGNK
tara:strand:+ start:895 stop:1056 length:162 start_codon:yes stop_codon:yes gene_type:complete